MNVPEPQHVTQARALVVEAMHATEHITRPGWCLDGTVPATQMTTERGNLRINRESCRYCLADQAAALGLGPALEAYLNTPAPPPRQPITEADVDTELERRRAEAADGYSIAAEYEARQALIKSPYFTVEEYDALDPTARAVFDVLWEHLDDDYELTPGVIADLITAVRRTDAETSRSANAPEQPGEAAPLIPDIPLFIVEGDTP